MSEHIVHTAILEDSFSICKGLSAVPESIREIMQCYGPFARLGCVTVSGDSFSFRLLEEFKPLWQERDGLLSSKLAFVLGWISHRACDRQMKPIWREPGNKGRGHDVDPNLSPTECSVYHEGYIYNQYYSYDPKFRMAIFPAEMNSLAGVGAIDLKAMDQFTQQSFGANMMHIQTIDQDAAAQLFFEEMCMRAQKFYVDIARYTNSAGSPDPALTAEYINDIDWYDDGDPIIHLARAIRSGNPPALNNYDSIYAEEAKSHYGKALRQSIGYIITSAEYLESPAMTIGELKERLDIGKKGPGGMAV